MDFSRKTFCKHFQIALFLFMFPLLLCSRELIKDRHINTENYYRDVDDSNPEILRKSIHKKISNHRVYSYKEIWEILMDTDADPDKKGYVILIYTQKSIPFESNNSIDNNNKDFWNREHVWPKSHGFKKASMTPYTDAHNLKPADRTVNSSKGNKDFDYSDKDHKEARNTKIDSDSFEPPPEERGDVARILFYMDVRYEGDNDEPDLILIDSVKTSGIQFGKLCTLLQWHHDDPVSPFERRRNERIYFWQKNRNPFIDHPEWADILWGKKCSPLRHP